MGACAAGLVVALLVARPPRSSSTASSWPWSTRQTMQARPTRTSLWLRPYRR